MTVCDLVFTSDTTPSRFADTSCSNDPTSLDCELSLTPIKPRQCSSQCFFLLTENTRNSSQMLEDSRALRGRGLSVKCISTSSASASTINALLKTISRSMYFDIACGGSRVAACWRAASKAIAIYAAAGQITCP